MAPLGGLQGQPQLPVSGSCLVQGVPGKDAGGPDQGIGKGGNGHPERYPQSGDVKRLGRVQPSTR